MFWLWKKVEQQEENPLREKNEQTSFVKSECDEKPTEVSRVLKSECDEKPTEVPRVQNSKNKKVLLVVMVSLFLVGGIMGVVALVVFGIKPVRETYAVKTAVSDFVDDYKSGMLQEINPYILYDVFVSEVPEEFIWVVDYFLGDEDVWIRGWDSVLTTLEYDIRNIEKQEEGYYLVEVTFTNKNLVLILTETVADLVDEYEAVVAGAFLGVAVDKFWDEYDHNRDHTNSTKSGTVFLEVRKEDDWYVDYDEQLPLIIDASVGVDDKYTVE